MYFERHIDRYLEEWATRVVHKPLLLRGARQVGKSTAVRHLGEKFDTFIEINLEKEPSYGELFKNDINIKRIVPQISVMSGLPVQPGKTLLFIDEIQMCPEAIMALRFFKEDMPGLHVVAAGSLLELVLQDIPTFGVGRIHSMFMYPMTFDEFLKANGEDKLIEMRNQSTPSNPLPDPIYRKITSIFREYLLVGGMPEAVATWVRSHDYLECQEIQDDIIVSYEDDFVKYKKKANPTLLRNTLRSAALQIAQKFNCSAVRGDYRSAEVKQAMELLILSGLLIPVTRTDANGIPLGSEADESYRKILLLDSGILLRLLGMESVDVESIATEILTADNVELVNKGSLTEMVAGLEILRYKTPNIRHDLYYWTRNAKNSVAEIDYVGVYDQKVLPIEVKAGVQGGMKSLWLFMREKSLFKAIRCSLENFGELEYIDKEADNSVRQVTICPLYSISQMSRLV